MQISETLRTLSTMGKDMVEKQKNEWIDEADIRLRAIVNDAEERLRIIADDSTAKLRRTIFIATGIITAGLVILSATIAFTP